MTSSAPSAVASCFRRAGGTNSSTPFTLASASAPATTCIPWWPRCSGRNAWSGTNAPRRRWPTLAQPAPGRAAPWVARASRSTATRSGLSATRAAPAARSPTRWASACQLFAGRAPGSSTAWERCRLRPEWLLVIRPMDGDLAIGGKEAGHEQRQRPGPGSRSRC